jgi:hypothetical protein
MKGKNMGYTHGKHWTDDDVKREVRNVMDCLCIDRMPSRSECLSVCGNEALANKISKRPGGWYGLSRDLGLSMKVSCTRTGKINEFIVQEMLNNKGFSTEKMSQNFPYDLLVDKSVKVDVKASKMYRGRNGNFYSFHIEKQYATCDIYVLLTLNDDETIKQIYVVPSAAVISNTQISIGETHSKYDEYIDRWDYITSLSAYWKRTLNVS